jgi:hypothetical protein
MSEITEHGQQLASAATAVLSPLGCVRVRRSRTWIADQRFWVIVIEFQPSGFSKGSYLNVGANWLWHAKNHWSFDQGGRVEAFIPYREAPQFASAAEHLATRAADELRLLRQKFASLTEIARKIVPDANVSGWPVYHAAVATGLTGDFATSERLFNLLANEQPGFDWHRKLLAESAELARSLTDTAMFRGAVLTKIQEARKLHKLPLDPGCLDNT